MFGCLIISETRRDRRTEDLLCRAALYLGIQTFQREHCQFTLACHHGRTHPLRTECEGGMDERCVTNGGKCERGSRVGPFPGANRDGSLRASGCSPLSLLTFFAAAKKVSAAPHRGEANRPLRIQGKANAARATAKPRRRRQPPRREDKKTVTRSLAEGNTEPQPQAQNHLRQRHQSNE